MPIIMSYVFPNQQSADTFGRALSWERAEGVKVYAQTISEQELRDREAMTTAGHSIGLAIYRGELLDA